MNFEEKRVFLVNTAFVTVVIALVAFVTKFMLSYLLPFILGLIIAFLVQKPARFVSQKIKINKNICAAALSVMAYIIVVGIILLLVWLFFSNVNGFINALKEYIPKAINRVYEFIGQIRFYLGASDDTWQLFLNESGTEISSKITAGLSQTVTVFVKSLPNFLFSTIVTIVASCYIAKDFDKLMKFFSELIKKNTYENILTIKEIIQNSVVKIVCGYLGILMINFSVLTVGLLLLNVGNPIVIALIIATIDILPVLGAGTILLPWSAIQFFNGNTSLGFGLLAMYITVVVIKNFLEPKIIGRQIGISPLFTLVSMFLGLRLAGIAGLVILPITLIVVVSFYKRQIEDDRLSR